MFSTVSSSSLKESSSSTSLQSQPLCAFFKVYCSLVKQYNVTHPTLTNCAKLKQQNSLHFCADYIVLEEWRAILEALKQDLSLHVIKIYGKYTLEFLHNVRSDNDAFWMSRKLGHIRTHFMFNKFLISLGGCLQNSQVLTYLELCTLPLYPHYFKTFLYFFAINTSLKFLSLKECFIGNDCTYELCRILRKKPNIEALDLSSNNLGFSSAQDIANLIKYQQLNRTCECWENSLRYRELNVDSIKGLKRLTLNNNPDIGDDGASIILDELENDLWIKAIDMQKCGVTEKISPRVISVVKNNSSLVIADFRHNENLHNSTITNILNLLKYKQDESIANFSYRWLRTARSSGNMQCSSTSTTSLQNSGRKFHSKSDHLITSATQTSSSFLQTGTRGSNSREQKTNTLPRNKIIIKKPLLNVPIIPRLDLKGLSSSKMDTNSSRNKRFSKLYMK